MCMGARQHTSCTVGSMPSLACSHWGHRYIARRRPSAVCTLVAVSPPAMQSRLQCDCRVLSSVIPSQRKPAVTQHAGVKKHTRPGLLPHAAYLKHVSWQCASQHAGFKTRPELLPPCSALEAGAMRKPAKAAKLCAPSAGATAQGMQQCDGRRLICQVSSCMRRGTSKAM